MNKKFIYLKTIDRVSNCVILISTKKDNEKKILKKTYNVSEQEFYVNLLPTNFIIRLKNKTYKDMGREDLVRPTTKPNGIPYKYAL